MIFILTIFRSVIGHLLILPWTIFVSLTVIALGAMKRHDAVTYWMALWSKAVLWFYGVHVKRDGLEKLPVAGGAILIFNHQSHFDIPAVTAFAERRLRYGAKIELFKIPFFGPAIRASGCLPIARENRQEVLRIYEEASEKFREGVIFALAPEGTRQSLPVIGAFKKGPFVFATRGQVPVVPVVIEGADRVMPKGHLLVNVGRWKRTIQVRACDPIFPDRIDINDEKMLMVSVGELATKSREIVLRNFESMQEAARASGEFN